MFKKENRTIPNYLSLSRIVFLPLLYYLAIAEMLLAFTITYAIVASTDWLDGQIARRFNQKSPLGAKMDSLCDVPFYKPVARVIFDVFQIIRIAGISQGIEIDYIIALVF